MASLRMRTVLALLGLLFPVPQSFVIRKRSVAGYDAAAAKDPKSTFSSSDRWLPAEGGLGDDAGLLEDPYSRGRYLAGDPDSLALDLMVPSVSSSPFYDDQYLNDVKDENEEERGFDGEYGTSLIPDNDEDDDDDDDEDDDGEGGVDGDGATLLDKSELENLFENESDGEEETQQPPMASVERKSVLTKDAVERLLTSPADPSSSGSEVRRKVVTTETKILVGGGGASSNATRGGDRPSYEGVRVVEVTERQPNGETRRQKQTDWVRSPDSKKQADADATTLDGAWSTAASDDDDPEGQQRVRHKVKRSEFSATDPDEEQGISDAELLKTYIRLQTEENRHLEQALNLAITTQVENSDEYLSDELGQMRLAVESEDALEAIREAIRRRQSNTGEEEEEQEQEEEEEDDDDDDLEGEQERIDGDDVGDADDDEFSRRLLRAKLKKFLIDSAVDELKAAGAEEGELGAEEEEEEEEEEGAEDHLYPNAKVLNPFTRNAYGEYGKPKRSEEYDEPIRPLDEDVMLRGTNDVDITDLLDTPTSAEPGGKGGRGGYYCPPVGALTDDCLTATSEGLALDAEAVSLCNRHQICYLCGSVFGMTSDTCDRGYLGESEQLCSGSEQCTREAAGLYLVLAKARRFVSTSAAFDSNDGVCAADCVYDYIVGDADDNDDRR